MDYRSALQYIISFSDYERHPGAGYAERWDLRRMDDCLGRLGSPHLDRRTVHIAGSKGKGSTAAMIASTLEAAGWRTGLYTSPHLHTMRERIRVGDCLISEAEFARITARMRPAIEAQNRGDFGELSTFEILTALGFVYFQEKGCQFQVLETGLGGRLDATNVVPHPEICVLTSISLDHIAVLGDTLAGIAAEKAGIVKAGTTVISASQAAEAMEVIASVCREKQVPLLLVGREISWCPGEADLAGQSLKVTTPGGAYDVRIPLLGEHQLENAAVAVGAVEQLGIDREDIARGLRQVRWPGRMQVLGREPLLIADGAHNDDSARKLALSLRRQFKCDKSILILGTSADKNAATIVAELASRFDTVITTASEHPRASDPKTLAAQFSRHGVEAIVIRTVSEALAAAQSLASKNDLICITGSLFVVAEAIEKVTGIAGERYPQIESGHK